MLQRIGRYEILERIAAGGQGTVHPARDTVLDRVVAVKIINQLLTDAPQYLEALQREARLAARLNHPSITRVYDFQWNLVITTPTKSNRYLTISSFSAPWPAAYSYAS